MKKLIGNVLLVFAVLYPSSALASSVEGKAIYCEKRDGGSDILGYRFESALGVHFYSAKYLRIFDNTDRGLLIDTEYKPMHREISWHAFIGRWELDRQSLSLEIFSSRLNQPLMQIYGCEVVSLRVMKAKLEESRKRATTGNKL